MLPCARAAGPFLDIAREATSEFTERAPAAAKVKVRPRLGEL